MKIRETNKEYVILTWEEPEDNGGSDLINYVVEKRDSKKTDFVNAGRCEVNVKEFKVSKLIEGNEYFFRVLAENNIGLSDPATTQQPVKARLPFGNELFCHRNQFMIT